MSVCLHEYLAEEKFVYQGHRVKVKVKVTGAKSVSVCPVWALDFLIALTYKLYFWCAGTSSEQVKVALWGQCQGHAVVTKLIAGGLPSSKRQSCYSYISASTDRRQ